MASGQPHYTSHRPMFPEYRFVQADYRNLYLLEGNRIYEKNGHGIAVSSATDVLNHLWDSYGACYTHNLSQHRHFPNLRGFASHPKCKVICTREGIPICIRIGTKNGSRWIVQADSWDECAEPGIIERMWDLYTYVGLGFAPTPSSLGKLMQFYIHYKNKLPRHTALGLDCEEFLIENAPPGLIQTFSNGSVADVEYGDMSSAFLAHYQIHPAGRCVWFQRGLKFDGFATWFAKCEVVVRDTLPLGPFPIKDKKDWRKPYKYPTERGKYVTFLWKEQAETCERLGISVTPLCGYGWSEFTSDNREWAQYSYFLRKAAPQEHLQEKLKATAVSGIGRQGMSRTHYYLVTEDRASITDRPMTVGGEPIDLFEHEEYDKRSAYMTHWNKYTVNMTSLDVFKEAWQYAVEGRLVMLYHDSMMVLEGGDDSKLKIKKMSLDAMACREGTWLWRLLHDCEVYGDGSFRSKELTRLPGVKHTYEQQLLTGRRK